MNFIINIKSVNLKLFWLSYSLSIKQCTGLKKLSCNFCSLSNYISVHQTHTQQIEDQKNINPQKRLIELVLNYNLRFLFSTADCYLSHHENWLKVIHMMLRLNTLGTYFWNKKSLEFRRTKRKKRVPAWNCLTIHQAQ